MALLIIFSLPIGATDVSSKRDELENTKQQMENAKNELDQTKKDQEVVKNEMDTLDKEITSVEEKILKIESDLEAQKQEVARVEEELALAIEKKDIQYAATKERMIQMYKNSKTGYIELVFSSGSLSELLNRSQYIKTISKYDNQLLEDYEAQEVIIKEKQEEVEQEQAKIETLYAEQVSVKKNLASMRQAKNEKLGMLKQQEGSLHANIEGFEEISKQLEAEITRLTRQSTVKYNGGAFAWPVPNNYRISSEYNPRDNPISGKAEFHQGIDIPAGYGKPVVAAADGRVITAGWVNGFGNTIMIDHGSGIVSLYGHNSSVTVSTGDWVNKGDQVAKIGSTGYSTGNHCHFEIRINGRHTNPWTYLNK